MQALDYLNGPWMKGLADAMDGPKLGGIEMDPVEARQQLRIKAGLDKHTLITDDDVEAIARALGRE